MNLDQAHKIAAIVVLFFVSACASIQYGKSKQSNITLLQANMTPADVISTIGEPKQTELVDQFTVWHYKVWIDDGSLVEKSSWYQLVFSDGKLVKYQINDRANQADYESNQRMSQSLMNLSNQMREQNRVPAQEIRNSNCTYTPNGAGGFYSNCTSF